MQEQVKNGWVNCRIKTRWIRWDMDACVIIWIRLLTCFTNSLPITTTNILLLKSYSITRKEDHTSKITCINQLCQFSSNTTLWTVHELLGLRADLTIRLVRPSSLGQSFTLLQVGPMMHAASIFYIWNSFWCQSFIFRYAFMVSYTTTSIFG